MSTFAEYTRKKKKKELDTSEVAKRSSTFREYTETVLGVDIAPTVSHVEIEDDIAPTASRNNSDKEDKKWYQGWLKKSEGNFGQAVGASGVDLAEDTATGAIGSGEKLLDALMAFAPAVNNVNKINAGQMLDAEDWKEHDKLKKSSEEFIKKDLYNEAEVAKRIITTPFEKKTGIDVESMSVFDKKADSLAQSAGQMVVTVGGSLINPTLGTALLGGTSFGSEMENALNNGATYDEAMLSSAITAGAEILSEKISGGISLGGKTLDDLIPVDKLAQGISNKVVRNLINIGIDATGEGFEEIVSGILSAVGQKMTYMEEKELKELFSSEEALESFLGGAILGGISGTGKTTINAVKGNDSLSGLSKNEKAVFDKVYNDAIAKEESEGNKLTQKEKNKIYDDTLKKLEKGYIDTDTIESVLGGETYKSLKSATENETKLKEEYDALNKMKIGEMTGEQTDRKEELKKQLEELKNNSKTSEIRKQLDSEMLKAVQGTKLAESYNEIARRKQSLEVDVESYKNESAKQTAQNFKDFGVNNSNASHDYLDLVTKVSEDRGHTFKFMSTKQLEESIANGNPYNITEDASKIEAFVSESKKEIIINMDANKSLTSLVGHEVMHTLEKANSYADTQSALFEYAKTKGEYDDRLASIKRRYSNLTEEQQMQELASDLVGDYIFGDTDFVRNLSTEKPNVFKKIYNEIKYLWKMATAGSKEARELERVKKEFEKIWQEASNAEANNIETETVSDAEVNSILEDNGVQPVHRQGGDVGLDKFGFNEDGSVKYSIADDVSDFDSWLDGLSIDELISFMELDEISTNEETKANKKTKRRVDEVNKRLKKIGLTFNGTKQASWTDERIEKYLDGSHYGASHPDYAQAYISYVTPQQYLNLTVGGNTNTLDSIQNESESYGELDFDKLGNSSPISLYISENGNTAKVKGHEGRHRMYLLGKAGFEKVPVLIFNYDNKYEKTTKTNLKLTAQRFNDTDLISKSRDVILEEAIPFNNRNKDIIIEKFGSGNTNADIRFSLKESVEETKDLIAVHNLNSSELSKTLELGGLPMPSVAVIKAQDGHEMYGDVTLILPKETIDPKASKANKVYGGDAWTPTYPNIEYKPNEKVVKKVHDKYYDFAKKHGYDEARPLFRYVNEMEDVLNREGGETSLLNKLYEDTNLMHMYLQDAGKEKVQPITKETVEKISEAEMEMNQFLIDTLGTDLVESYKIPDGENPMQYRRAYMAEHEAEIRDAYAKLCEEVYGFTAEEVKNVLDKTETKNLMKIMRDAYLFTQNNGVTVKTETDYKATSDAIRESAKDGYKEWVDDLFKGVEEKTGIRNNADAFTRSGNRRSWDALHWENTLENVVKVMKQQDNGQALFGGVGIWGVSAKEYGSIKEIKADSDRLRKMSEEDYAEVKESYQHRLSEIAGRIMSKTERNQFIAIDDAMSAIVDSVRVSKTEKGIFKELKQYTNLTVTEKDASDIASLVKDISNMPTGYFEAKPKRAVGLDEVGVFVIPYNADAKLKQELLSKGYSIAEYDPNVEGDRKRVLNEFEQYKFRMADDNSYTSKEYGNHIYAKDVMLEGDEEIAPTTTDTTVEEMPIRSDYVPSETVEDENESNRIIGEDLTKKNADKIRTIQAEIKGHKLTRDIAKKEFDDKIAKKESEYESLKRKDTKKAVDLRNQITNLETRRDSILQSYDNKIERANKRIESIERESRFEKRKTKQKEYRELFGNLMGDTSTWVDKKLGIQYQTNTLRRNLRDIVKDASGNQDIARADAIYDELQGSVNQNEAKKNREANEVKDAFREMKINNAESTYIQMLGELRHNPDTTLTQDVVDEFYNKNKGKIDTQKVDKAIEEARKLYDSLYERVNASLSEHGFKEMGYRKGYFPHFTDPKQNWLAKLLNWKVNNDEIPTDIAGITETFEPQRTWQSFDKHRKTDTTDYNFLKGLDNYVNGALDWIYHIEDIQKHRAFETEIRYRHSSEEVQKKIDEYRNNPMLSTEEADTLIQNALREAQNPLNNFVTDLHTRTNILAGKKSSKDRNMESDFNRHAYSIMTNVTNRVTANQVVGSVSSALTNFIPITQSWGQVNPTSSLVGMKQTIQSYMSDDGVVAKSDFLTNRIAMNEALYKDAWDKIGEKVGGLMEIVDNFTSQTIWRSKYHENIKNGMSEEQAIKNADQFAENVIGGRSKGNMPTIFHAKNPVTKMLTSFQLEVANQYGYMFKDMPQDIGKDAMGKLIKGYATMFVGAYAYNALYSTLTGRDSAFDPIGIIEEFIRDLAGDDDDEEKDVAGAVGNLASNIADNIPFVGGLLGGGRIPISSALPYNASIPDAYADVTEGDWKSVMDELSKPLYYAVLPMGGGQIRKTVQGLSMFDEDLPVSGSYTKSGGLRFPVEDTFLNKLQAGVFGQYASSNAREYFDRGQAPLKEKQIQEYMDVDLPISEYWDYREGLKGLTKLSDKADYINSLDLPIDKKNLLVNNQSDREEPIDLTGFNDDFENFEEFDFAVNNPDKYEIAEKVGGYKEYKKYQEGMKDMKLAEKADYIANLNLSIEQKNALINGETDRKEPIDLTGYENYSNFEEFELAKENPKKYSASLVIGYDDFTKYMDEISEIRADKDSNGKTINGSAKRKKTDYINSLDLDYGQRIILYRSLFDSESDKKMYNADIVEYLNNREDISYEEMVTILEALDFKVYQDGTVTW